jgi:hypothetical protein
VACVAATAFVALMSKGSLPVATLGGETTASSEAAGSTETIDPETSLEPGGLSMDDVLAMYQSQDDKPRLDTTILGWRFAPYPTLLEEGIANRALDLDCEGREAGAETSTALDFSLAYLPSSLELGSIEGPTKWICGDEPLIVEYVLNVSGPLGNAQLWVERAVWGSRTMAISVPSDSAEVGTVNDAAAIYFHPAHDETGLGVGRVIVIEDDEEPRFVVLRVMSDDAVPFHELVKIAEGVR